MPEISPAEFREVVLKRVRKRGSTFGEAFMELAGEGRTPAQVSGRKNLNARRKSEYKGWGRDAFARLVQSRQSELMVVNPSLTPLAAIRKAVALIVTSDAEALKAYHEDSEES